MPRKTPIEGLIPEIYQKSALHQAVFFWVSGQISAFPNGISMESAIKNLYKFANITEEDLPIKTAKQMYLRMNRALIEKIKGDA